MNLNSKGRNKLRKYIEEQLKNVPSGQLAHIDKEILDAILFEKVIYNEKNDYFKLPVWSGDFLSKIDLSEVDFENVSWSVLGENTENNMNKLIESLNENQNLKLIQNDYDLSSFNGIINYSNTNKKIEFKESIEYKINQKVVLNNCNFRNADLINNAIENYSINNCDLSNTYLIFKKFNIKEIVNSNLYGLNLIRFSIEAKDLVNYFINVTENIDLMNLNNTRLRILTDRIDKKEIYLKLKSLIKNGKLDGCTINGNQITSGKIIENKESIIDKIKFEIKFMRI